MMMINPNHPHDQIRYAIVGFGDTLDASGTIADAEQEVLRDVRQVQSGYYDFILVLVPNCTIVDQIVREHPDRRLIFSVAPFH